MIGQTLDNAESRCCGYPLRASLRPCFSDRGAGPLVQCAGCDGMQEVRLWCGICGKDAPVEAYAGYDAVAAVKKLEAENQRKQAALVRVKNKLGDGYRYRACNRNGLTP